MSLKIVIAEDNNRIAKSLIQKLELFDDLQVKGWEPDGQALIDNLESYGVVDLVLMDINMPIRDGISTTEELKKLFPHLKIIMSTVFDEEHHIFQSILAGANGYLLKDERPEKLYASIKEVMEGGAPMSATVARKALNLIRYNATSVVPAEEKPEYNLTSRELEILEQLTTGRNYNEIAENLFISTGTVRKHIENIYQKLQVHNKVEAVQLAIKNRLI
jgi:DNA-binding NarL/FixJ family response regulator